MNKKNILKVLIGLSSSLAVTSLYANENINTNQICSNFKDAKIINMNDMQFKYYKEQSHICSILKVKISNKKNNSWKEKGSGWFAAGFGAKTMKGSNMFIFVPKSLDTTNTKYDIFANIGGGYGPTLALDTKPKKGQIQLLSSSLGKVKFAIYPNEINGLSMSDQHINMIFSHSRPGIIKFAPGHIATYDYKFMTF